MLGGAIQLRPGRRDPAAAAEPTRPTWAHPGDSEALAPLPSHAGRDGFAAAGGAEPRQPSATDWLPPSADASTLPPSPASDADPDRSDLREAVAPVRPFDEAAAGERGSSAVPPGGSERLPPASPAMQAVTQPLETTAAAPRPSPTAVLAAPGPGAASAAPAASSGLSTGMPTTAELPPSASPAAPPMQASAQQLTAGEAAPALSGASEAGAAASPPPAEPGVLLPRASDLGSDAPLQQTPTGGHPTGGLDPASSRDARQRELVLDRRQRQLLVIENGTPLRRFPVAVGMPGWETPVGRFAVIEMQTNPTWEHPVSGLLIQPGPDNPLGSRWIGFYRDCQGRRGFNGQEHLVVQGCVVAGFHGTPNRASIGRAASHGCVRLYDEHVRDLFDLVRLGTPVTVLP